VERHLTNLDAAALLAHAVHRDTVAVVAKQVQVSEARLLDMIECLEPMPRRVVLYLGLRREVRYVEAN
jgi:hypothetical protein